MGHIEEIDVKIEILNGINISHSGHLVQKHC